MRLQGKAALVTGAGQGFGFGIAEIFVREGARVACLDLKSDVAEAAAKRFGGGAIALKGDVSNRRGRQASGARCDRGVRTRRHRRQQRRHDPSQQAAHGGAGGEFDRVFAVNVKSILLTAQAFIPHMRAHGGGVFINVGSTAALRPRPRLTVYNASKGAVDVHDKLMAVELAPEQNPGLRACRPRRRTPLLAMFMGEDTPEKRAAFRATVPLGRFSTPHDIVGWRRFISPATRRRS